MTSDEIVLTEGDNSVEWTFTCKRAGSVVDLTGTTVKLYLHDDDAAEGTNILDDGGSNTCTLDADPTTGQCTFTFTTTHTTISGTGRVVKGTWKLKVDGESFDQGRFRIEKDEFTA